MPKTTLQILALAICISIYNAKGQTTVHKLIDTVDFDHNIRPGDNFFKYVNGTWLKNTDIPSSKTSWGTIQVLAEESQLAIKKILEQTISLKSKDRSQKMLADFYESAMDSLSLEKLGIQPIKADLERIMSIKNNKEIIDEIILQKKQGIGSPVFTFSVGQDAKRATAYIIQFNQGGISLPDKDYYFKEDARSKNIRQEYEKYVRDIFILSGLDSTTSKEAAQNVLNIETKLAAVHYSKVDMRDPQKTYNKICTADLDKKCKALQWKVILDRLAIGQSDSVVLNNPSFFYTTDSLLNEIPLAQWKFYLQWGILRNSAAYLSNVFVIRNFQFNKILSGQVENTPRWQRATNLIDSKIGDLLGKEYVSYYFKPEAKKRMLELVNNLQKAFEKRIRQLIWMSDETKKKAIEKLHAVYSKIGYPDKWKTYEGVSISRDSFIQNIRNCNKWSVAENLKKLGKAVDKTEWGFTPPTVNAYYNPQLNEILFPAGILQFPFFDEKADDALIYGAIGAVIGHEITHGFDDKGRQYDADGNLNDWWQESDAQTFGKIAKKIADEYDSVFVIDSIHINGKLTLGENIADMGGLQIAYEAFKNTPEGKSDKMIDGFTPDQRFFISWARIWRNKMRPESLIRQINTDPHSPGEYRCNKVLQNMDAFQKAFGLKRGDLLFREKNNTIVIW